MKETVAFECSLQLMNVACGKESDLTVAVLTWNEEKGEVIHVDRQASLLVF